MTSHSLLTLKITASTLNKIAKFKMSLSTPK